MNKITISDAIQYVGVNDHNIDLFEGQYVVPDGVSYNSYIILDEKIAVMDTVDKTASEQWLANIESTLDGKKPHYLVVSHLEPDHSACVKIFIEKYPDVKLIGNTKTFSMLHQFYEITLSDDKKVVVGEGDKVSLGTHTLNFIMAPMVHWPEVMLEYEETEKVLFAADAFGKFGALDVENDDWACEARRYYFNIVGKYGAMVQTLLKKAAGLEINTICPLHGPVLKENLGYYINLYDTWSKYEPEDKGIFIAYASMHGNTAEAAEKLAEILEKSGKVKVSISDLARDDIAEAIEDAFRYDRLVLCAPTYNAGLAAKMDDFLRHLSGLAYQNRTVAIVENGSWAPMAAKKMREILDTMKDITVIEPVVTIKSTVKDTDVTALEELASVLLEQ